MKKSEHLKAFIRRKEEHINLALAPENQAHEHTGLADINLIHNALPELDFDDMTLSTRQLGRTMPTPFFVSPMTAGHAGASQINQALIEACSETGWSMGVGSQRRQLSDPLAKTEWQTLRQASDNVCLFGNLGLSQAITTPIGVMQELVDSLQANAMIIHCNPLQECLQMEGTPRFKGGLHALGQLSQHLNVPVIVKETGCGFSQKNLQQLNKCGIAAVDVSGLGGTHWGRIEGQRADPDDHRSQAAQIFKHWGITTASSLRLAANLALDYELWASGGVRSGLDAAKLLALGATSVGFAKPLLEAALQGKEAVIDTMRRIEFELRIALFCTGSSTIQALQENHPCL